VPGYAEGRLTSDTTLGGPVRVSRARRTVTASVRCCAGRQGTTTTFRVAGDGTLVLARVEEWTLDDAARRTVRVAYPAAATPGPRATPARDTTSVPAAAHR